MPTTRSSLALVLAVSAALLCFVSSARATVFDFSYDFGAHVFSGSFTGSQSGNLVTGVSNVSLFDNGISVGSPIYAGSYNGGYQAGGTVFSFDGTANNIALFNIDYFTTGSFPSSEAYLIQSPYLGSDIYWFNSFNAGSETFNVSNWSLAVSGQGVPDGGVTAAMLGGAFLGFAALRRRFSRS